MTGPFMPVPFGPGGYDEEPERTLATVGSWVFGVPGLILGGMVGLILEPYNIITGGLGEAGMATMSLAFFGSLGGGVLGRFLFGAPVRIIKIIAGGVS